MRGYKNGKHSDRAATPGCSANVGMVIVAHPDLERVAKQRFQLVILAICQATERGRVSIILVLVIKIYLLCQQSLDSLPVPDGVQV